MWIAVMTSNGSITDRTYMTQTKKLYNLNWGVNAVTRNRPVDFVPASFTTPYGRSPDKTHYTFREEDFWLSGCEYIHMCEVICVWDRWYWGLHALTEPSQLHWSVEYLHSFSHTPMKCFWTNFCGLCADLLAFDLNGEVVWAISCSPLL